MVVKHVILLCKSCLTGYRFYCSKEQNVNNCPPRIGNCDKCQNNICIQCSYGFILDPKEKRKCFPKPNNNDYYYDSSQKTYIKYLDSPYLERCFECKDSKTCTKCDTRSHILSNGK